MKLLNRFLMPVALTLSCILGMGSTFAEAQIERVIEEKQRVLTVESIDLESRLVIFKDDVGQKVPLFISDNVNNLEQVTPGDKVTVSFQRALAAEIKPANSIQQKEEIELSAQSSLGDKPQGASVKISTVTVTVDLIDLEEHTVSFTDPDGYTHIVSMSKQEGKDFLATLTSGDLVDITYSEGVAFSVKPIE